MKNILLIIFCINLLFATDNNTTIKQPAITISQKTIDDTLKEYNKTLVLLKNTEKSISQYHDTLKTAIQSLQQKYNEVSPNIEKKVERIVTSLEDMNSTVKLSMDQIEKSIDDYYLIEIFALIAFLISVNNILDIITTLKKFKFIRKFMKKLFKKKKKKKNEIQNS